MPSWLEFKQALKNIKSETIGWVGLICLHGATIPGLMALMMGITDNVPSLDVVMLLWTGLILFFIKAMIERNMVNIATISIGFIVQSFMLVLIFFK